jgi:hypothetical protein
VLRKDDLFDHWFPLGFLLGVALTSLASLGAGAVTFSTLITDNQIIIGSVIGIVTALWTVRAQMKSSSDQVSAAIESTNQHIAAAQRIEASRQEERLRAARAILTFALTEIIAYSDSATTALFSLQEQNVNAGLQIREPATSLVTGRFRAPSFPVDELPKITSVIESCSKEVAHELASLLKKIQICVSRLREFQDVATNSISSITTHHIRERAIYVCALHAQTSRYFEYGRFIVDDVNAGPLSREEIFESARLIAFSVRTKGVQFDTDDEWFVRLVPEKYPAAL